MESSLSLGSLSTSRFLLAHLAMLTGEHSAVDLSSLLTGGLMGLAQAVIRLAGESRWSECGSGLFHSHYGYYCTVMFFRIPDFYGTFYMYTCMYRESL